jgi:hypothetical protein
MSLCVMSGDGNVSSMRSAAAANPEEEEDHEVLVHVSHAHVHRHYSAPQPPRRSPVFT